MNICPVYELSQLTVQSLLYRDFTQVKMCAQAVYDCVTVGDILMMMFSVPALADAVPERQLDLHAALFANQHMISFSFRSLRRLDRPHRHYLALVMRQLLLCAHSP
jgi:hypothetical protein